MLIVDGISKRYGDHTVLDGVSFALGDGEKIAVVGPNGCGKSTLLRIIAGEERADAGSIGGNFAHGVRYLPQGALDVAGRTAAETTPALGELWQLGRAIERDTARTPDEALVLLDRFEAAGGWTAYAAVEDTLRGLGLDALDPEQPYAQLSGGERTKLALAGLLYQPGRCLLLDEPTNHLDLQAIDWLERFLEGFAGALLLASHDRALIDAVAGAVVELDPETHRARRFAGGYSDYQEERERERRGHEEAYRRQQQYVQRVEEDIRRVKQHAAGFDATSANDYHRRIGKKVARTAKVRERRLEKLLTSTERLERPRLSWQMKADIVEAPRSGDVVIEARDLACDAGPRRLFANLSLLIRQGERVVLTGPNGGGKTTLLRLLLGELSPAAGTVRMGPSVVPGYLSQQQEGVDLDRTPLAEVRAAAPLDETAARTFLHRFLFRDDEVFARNRSLSFGQRSRLALACLLLSGVNLLVLDEPLNHLDIPSRERFETALAAFAGTVLAVSHDRYFIQRFAGRLLVLEQGHLLETDSEIAHATTR